MNVRLPILSLSFVRFSIVGITSTFIHVIAFSLLVELCGIVPLAASVPAFFIAMFTSYGLNHHWTFKARGSHRLYLPRYAVVALIGLGLNVLVTYVVVNLLGYWYGVALTFVVCVVPPVTFLLNRNWAFKIVSAKLRARQ